MAHTYRLFIKAEAITAKLQEIFRESRVIQTVSGFFRTTTYGFFYFSIYLRFYSLMDQEFSSPVLYILNR